MSVIRRRYEENEIKIIELDAVSAMVKDVLRNAVKIADRKSDDIEYRMILNGVELRFKNDMSVDKLNYIYQSKLKEINLF